MIFAGLFGLDLLTLRFGRMGCGPYQLPRCCTFHRPLCQGHSLPELAGVVGAKIIHDQRHYQNFGNLPPYSTVAQDDRVTYNDVAPKVGLLWEPKKDVQAFFDVTRSLDVPDFGDLTQTQNNGPTSFVPLQAQNAWTVETGTRGRQD